jgi:hypothetical protein
MNIEILNRRLESTGYDRLWSLSRETQKMPDEPPTASANRELAVKVVGAYLRRKVQLT